MLPLIIAGGVFLGTPQAAQTPLEPELTNITLLKETMIAKEVVTRNMWGTPMPPNGKGGYSVIQKINPDYINQSLIQPPLTTGPVFRPSTAVVVESIDIAPELPKAP